MMQVTLTHHRTDRERSSAAIVRFLLVGCCLLGSLLGFGSQAFAREEITQYGDWEVTRSVDEFDDSEQCALTATVQAGNGEIIIVVVDENALAAAAASDDDVQELEPFGHLLRVDKNPAIAFDKVIANMVTASIAEDPSLLRQLIRGQILHIRLVVGSHTRVEGAISLIGFTKARDELIRCRQGHNAE
jgi:invasion protein IalB